MSAKIEVYEKLNSLGIKYKIVDHDPVFTIEEMDEKGISSHGYLCKNLFLRDDNGKRHFLVVCHKDKAVDLKDIRTQIGSSRLSFASAERLKKYLNLEHGQVTPLGVINDTEHKVEVVFEKDMIGKENVGVHPNDNTATIWLSFDDILKVVKLNGNVVKYIEL